MNEQEENQIFVTVEAHDGLNVDDNSSNSLKSFEDHQKIPSGTLIKEEKELTIEDVQRDETEVDEASSQIHEVSDEENSSESTHRKPRGRPKADIPKPPQSEATRCPICHKNIRTRNFNLHMRHLHPDEPLSASKTPKIPPKAKIFKPRQRTFESDFQCRKCSKFLSSKHSLEGHMKSHKVFDKLKCKICGFNAVNLEFLARHQKVHETSENVKKERDEEVEIVYETSTFKIECEVCQLKVLPGSLHAHIRRIHPEVEATHKCEVCKKLFFHSNSLQAHRKIHAREWFCDFCGVKFGHKKFLEIHMNKHIEGEEEKLTPCPFCYQPYKEEDLKVHIESHRNPPMLL